MQSRLRVHGHPIQPILVTFPFGLFVCAVIFDLFALAGGVRLLGEVGYWTAVAGLVAAGLTVVAGLVDLWDVPPGRTRRAAISFTVVNLTTAGVFVVTCLVRADAPGRGVSAGLLVTELVALAVGALGVALGAHLVRAFDVARTEAGGLDALGAVTGSTGEVTAGSVRRAVSRPSVARP